MRETIERLCNCEVDGRPDMAVKGNWLRVARVAEWRRMGLLKSGVITQRSLPSITKSSILPLAIDPHHCS